MEAIRATQCSTHGIDRRCQASLADTEASRQSGQRSGRAGPLERSNGKPGGTLARHPIGRAEEPDDFCCAAPPCAAADKCGKIPHPQHQSSRLPSITTCCCVPSFFLLPCHSAQSVSLPGRKEAPRRNFLTQAAKKPASSLSLLLSPSLAIRLPHSC